MVMHWTVNPAPLARLVRSQYTPPNIGLKVFMDARMPVTHKEGDRYPLGPPNYNGGVFLQVFVFHLRTLKQQ